MGNVLRIFKHAKSTPEESFKQFEEIEERLQSIEREKMDLVRRQRNIIMWLYCIFWLLLIGSLVNFYLIMRSSSSSSSPFKERHRSTIGFIFVLLFIYLLKRLVNWYFRWSIENKNAEMESLRKEKQVLFEKIQDTEAFRVTKKIIGKYMTPKAQPSSPDSSGVRHRIVPHGNVAQTPLNAPRVLQNQRAYPMTPQQRPALGQTPMAVGSGAMVPMGRPSMPPPPRMARPILSHDRSVVEKLVDYVVGDGPSNRYALICANCKQHNGMALKDEFEYIAFYCCYCRYPNPARRTRPSAPHLATSPPPVITEPESDTDDKTSVEITECVDRESEKSEQSETEPPRMVVDQTSASSSEQQPKTEAQNSVERNSEECKSEPEDSSTEPQESTHDSSKMNGDHLEQQSN